MPKGMYLTASIAICKFKYLYESKVRMVKLKPAFRIRSHPDPLHLAGSGSTSIPAPNPDPLRFLSTDPDPDPLKKALIWIRVTPKLFRVISKTKCFCYLRNAFSKFLW